jgi:hypothetical protein
MSGDALDKLQVAPGRRRLSKPDDDHDSRLVASGLNLFLTPCWVEAYIPPSVGASLTSFWAVVIKTV